MKVPSAHKIEHLLRDVNNIKSLVNGKWVEARPITYHNRKTRFKLAWAVFTGKADALFWEGQ